MSRTNASEEDGPGRGGWIAAGAAAIVVAAIVLQYAVSRPFDIQAAAIAPPDRETEAVASAEAAAPEPARRLLRSYTDAAGFACRDFLQPVIIGDASVAAIGTVCRDEEGAWALVGDLGPRRPPASAPPAGPQSAEPEAATPRHADPSELRPGRERRARTPREAFLASSVAIRIAGVRGQSGSLILVREYDGDVGQPCRDYEQRARVGGATVRSAGTVCRQSDGRWVLVGAAAPVRTVAGDSNLVR